MESLFFTRKGNSCDVLTDSDILFSFAMGVPSALHSPGEFIYPFTLTWTSLINSQIIINRIALISSVQDNIKWVRIGVAVFITLINISVIATFIPAVLQVNPAYVAPALRSSSKTNTCAIASPRAVTYGSRLPKSSS